MTREEQISNGFTDMMKGLWKNQDLEVPNLETLKSKMTNEFAIDRLNDIRDDYERWHEIMTPEEEEALDIAIKALEQNKYKVESEGRRMNKKEAAELLQLTADLGYGIILEGDTEKTKEALNMAIKHLSGKGTLAEVYEKLQGLREIIIAMDLSYSNTRTLLGMILEIEHTIDDTQKEPEEIKEYKEYRKMKKVDEKQFNDYLKAYPNEWEANFFMDWEDYYDFSLKGDATGWEALDKCKIARKYFGYEGEEYFIPSEEVEDEDNKRSKK